MFMTAGSSQLTSASSLYTMPVISVSCRQTGTSGARKEKSNKSQFVVKFHWQMKFLFRWTQTTFNLSDLPKTKMQRRWKKVSLTLWRRLKSMQITDKVFNTGPFVCHLVVQMCWKMMNCVAPSWSKRELKQKIKKQTLPVDQWLKTYLSVPAQIMWNVHGCQEKSH